MAFLEAAHAKNYGKAWRYLDLRKMPDDQRLKDGAELARQLEAILDSDTQFDVGDLSRNQEGALFHVTLNPRRNTTPDQMRALLESFTKLLRDNPKFETGAMPVRFVGIGAYSLDIEIFIHVRTLDFDEFIMDAVESAGTALAVPTQATIAYPAQPAPAPTANGAPTR